MSGAINNPIDVPTMTQGRQKISLKKFLIDLFAKWEREEEVQVVLSSESLSV